MPLEGKEAFTTITSTRISLTYSITVLNRQLDIGNISFSPASLNTKNTQAGVSHNWSTIPLLNTIWKVRTLYICWLHAIPKHAAKPNKSQNNHQPKVSLKKL